MDINKEKEAFEAIAENIRLLRGAKFKDGKYVALSLLDESSKELAAQLNYGWKAWQAAKAQAEKALLEQFEINNKLVEQIEKLKAQAVPDGFVVVPKEPTPKMIDATWNFDEEIRGMSHNSRNEFIYNTMIAAALEPTND